MTQRELHWRKVLLFKRLAKHYDEEFLASYFKLPRREVARMKKEFAIVYAPNGKPVPRTSLNEAKAREVLRLRREGWSIADLADRFGVSTGTVLNIQKGRIEAFRHLLEEE